MILWAMPDSGARTMEDYAALVALFRKENPSIDLSVRVLTRNVLWRRVFKLKDPFHEEMPDLIQIPHYWTALIVKAGIAENLSQLDPGLTLTDSLPQLKENCYQPGTKDIYSYPWWFDLSALHYRVDHLKMVSSSPDEELKTWSGLLSVCAKLREKFKNVPGYYPMQNSDWRGSLSMRSALPCMWSRELNFFTEDRAATLVGSKEFKEALHDYITLALKEYMPILRERGSLGTIVSGKASMMLARKQGISTFSAHRGMRVRTVPVPMAGDKPAAYLSGMNLFINTFSQHKKDALQFIKFCARKDIQMRYATMIEAFPAFEYAFEPFLAQSPRLQTYKHILPSAQILPNMVIMGTVMEILKRVLAMCAAQIVEHRFTQALLDKELDMTAKEIEFLLSIYKG